MSSSLETAVDRAHLAQAEAEQARQQYREALVNAIRPTVAEFIKHERPDLDYESAISRVCAWLADHHKQETNENIRAAIANANVQPKPPLQGQELRDDLERQIMELLVASPEEKDRERKSYHARLAASRDEVHGRHQTGPYLVTTATMIQRLLNLKESERLRGLTHAELRAEVRGKAQQHRHEELPSSFTPWQISNLSAAEWKEALRKYGVQQLNERIQAQQAAGEWSHVPIVTKESK
jgi:hypothetical protein